MSWHTEDPADNGSDLPPSGDSRARHGGPGGDWQGVRPTFENPMSWSIPVARFAGISVRIHIIFLLFIAVVLFRAGVGSGSQSTSGPTLGDFPIAALAMIVLLLVVLAHELGHCFACRWTGGIADEILLWPLGGLAHCRPDHDWRAHFMTALGGPLVNLLIIALASPMLAMITGMWWPVAIPNPLQPLEGLHSVAVASNWAVICLYLINTTSMVLLVLNLLPMFPLDGGRLLHALLWRGMGYVRAMQLTVHVGYVGAIVLAIVGLVMYDLFLILVAAFGAITCFTTAKQLEWTEAVMSGQDEYAVSLRYGESDEGERPSAAERLRQRDAERQAQRQRREGEEVDRILRKISTSGMDSLSRSERRLLRRVSDRKRRE